MMIVDFIKRNKLEVLIWWILCFPIQLLAGNYVGVILTLGIPIIVDINRLIGFQNGFRNGELRTRELIIAQLRKSKPEELNGEDINVDKKKRK